MIYSRTLNSTAYSYSLLVFGIKFCIQCALIIIVSKSCVMPGAHLNKCCSRAKCVRSPQIFSLRFIHDGKRLRAFVHILRTDNPDTHWRKFSSSSSGLVPEIPWPSCSPLVCSRILHSPFSLLGCDGWMIERMYGDKGRTVIVTAQVQVGGFARCLPPTAIGNQNWVRRHSKF